MTIPVQFTCENCGRQVSFMDAGLYYYEHRNHCPACMRSRHIMFGTAQLPPCDMLMTPVDVTTVYPPFLITECDGCGFRWATYNEDWWATLTPVQQTTLSNLAWTETERQNGAPTVIYKVRPLYATPPPRIPASLLGTRTRVKRRP